MLRLYSAPLSLFAKKVEIALAEKALPFERALVAFSQSSGYAPRHPDVVAHNPKGQVPVLIDGDLALYDSTLIIDYLEDAYPAPPLYPAGARERAICRRWDLFADDVMLGAVRPLMHRNEPGASARPDWNAREAGAEIANAAMKGHFAALDAALAGREWLIGDFGAADIAVFMQAFWSQRLAGPLMQPFNALGDWYRRVRARPSAARMIEETLAADASLSAPVAGAFPDGI